MNILKTVLTSIIITLIVIFSVLMFIPSTRMAINNYFFKLEVVDQETDYKNRKMVEDSARSMIANYEFAKTEYESYASYCDLKDEDKCQRALDAKTSANKTATNYNNYILKNKYLWDNNLPSDIYYELEIIK